MMNTGPPWTTPHSPPQTPYPKQTDVLVIGSGPAACWCALTLAQTGTSVVMLVGKEGILGGFSRETLPKLTLGLTDSVSRLINGMGEEKTHFILDCGLKSRHLWSDIGAFIPTGGYHIAGNDKERQEIDDSAEHLKHHGGWRPNICKTDFGHALYSPEEGRIHTITARTELLSKLQNAGVSIISNTSQPRLYTKADGTLDITTDSGQINGTLVIHAEGWLSGIDDPFFANVLTPVREQWVAFSDAPDKRPNHRIQYGYQYWGWTETHLLYGGCRWGSMHFEVGETEPTCNPKIHAHLRRIATQRYPHLKEPTHAWASIMTHSCDGLPIIGSLPGRPNELSCTGFQGHNWSLAPALGQALAMMILEGDANYVPNWLQPQRLASFI